MASGQGSTEAFCPAHGPPTLPCPCRALTIQGGDDSLSQGQDQPQRAPEKEEVSDLEVELAQGSRAVQCRGAA